MNGKSDFAKRSLAVLVASAFLAAISIVCGKYLAISIGEVLRISFENLPILLGGIAFGPFWGAAIGIVADLIGCLMVGYTINPMVTLGAALIGFFSGASAYLLDKTNSPYGVKIAVSVGAAHLIGSVMVKTVGLAAYYSMPLPILMLWRLLNYLFVGGAEGAIIWYLLKNKLVTSQINSILKRNTLPQKSTQKSNTGSTEGQGDEEKS